MVYEEKNISSRCVFAGKVLNVFEDKVVLPNGEQSTREVIRHRGAAAVLVVDKEDNVFLCRQYRYALNMDMLEIPAGKVEEGCSFEQCAIAEAEEEVGVVPTRLVELADIYPSCGYTNERIKIYLVCDYVQGKQHLDKDEFLDVVKMPFVELLELVDSGAIKDAKTALAVLRYERMRKERE